MEILTKETNDMVRKQVAEEALKNSLGGYYQEELPRTNKEMFIFWAAVHASKKVVELISDTLCDLDDKPCVMETNWNWRRIMLDKMKSTQSLVEEYISEKHGWSQRKRKKEFRNWYMRMYERYQENAFEWSEEIKSLTEKMTDIFYRLVHWGAEYSENS